MILVWNKDINNLTQEIIAKEIYPMCLHSANNIHRVRCADLYRDEPGIDPDLRDPIV